MSSVLDMTSSDEYCKQLAESTRKVEAAKRALDSALGQQARDIVAVYSEEKTSMREIAEVANVSHQRIAQIIGSQESQDLKDKASDEILRRNQ